MDFYAYSLSALKCLEKFEEYFQHSVDNQTLLILDKIKSCTYRVLLVADDDLVIKQGQPEVFDEKTLVDLSNAWRCICRRTERNRAIQKKSWQAIEYIGESFVYQLPSRNRFLRHFSHLENEDSFFILLKGDESTGILLNDFLILTMFWQNTHGLFALHASGIQHKGNLFLFTGPSGAGKSTIAAFSGALGDQVIDEDQVLIHSLPEGGYSADGWGYGIVPCQAPLRAIFHLVQDSEDRLNLLNHLQVAKFIMERHSDIMGGMLSDDLLKKSFHLSCEIARQVPGYELHFRKSPDFWKLIDKQFSD